MNRWALGLIAILLSTLPASAGWWSKYWPSLPVCSDSEVLYKISVVAAWAERNTWHRGWYIKGIADTGETALNPTPSHIHRRYCRATAWLSDGRRTALIYVIEAGQGFVGNGWNVEYCLPAYDPWRVYDAWCRAITP